MAGASNSTSTARILAVDHHSEALRETTRILGSAGYEVLQASTAHDALSMAGRANLVVLDANLPDLDGFEVCRRLRARADTACLPVVHLSATFSQAEEHARGLEAGADSCLARPVDAPELVATVRTLLSAHQAQALRRDSDARLAAMFDLAPAALAVLTPELTYERVNPAFCDLLGYTAVDLHGRSALALLGTRPDTAAGHSTLRRDDGSRAEIEWRIATEPLSRVRVLQLTDVTDLNRLDAERESLLTVERLARTEAERSSRLKEEFLATLSHELRNPLNAILGWSTLLARTKDLSPQVMRAVSAIERNSRLQAQMIADLLDYAGITFGKMRIQLATVDAFPVVQQALDVVMTAAQGAEVTLHADFGPEPCVVEADPSRLQQIVWNLLSNAIKFSRKGGSVELSARKHEERFELKVRDHGVGISAEFLPHIFERFSQEDASSTRGHGGLGLGLAIVKQLVTLQSGDVCAFSDGAERGATFTVTLPLSSADAVLSLSDSQTVRSHDLAGVIALVVEDDVDARDLTKRILSDAGATVLEAASAQAALECVRTRRPHVLISDIGMAGTDGYQMLRQLRDSGLSAQMLPALALTAFARTQDRNDSFAAGFQDHLVKPVEAQVLVSRVARLRRSIKQRQT